MQAARKALSKASGPLVARLPWPGASKRGQEHEECCLVRHASVHLPIIYRTAVTELGFRRVQGFALSICILEKKLEASSGCPIIAHPTILADAAP